MSGPGDTGVASGERPGAGDPARGATRRWRVALLGRGRMGRAIAEELATHGHAVVLAHGRDGDLGALERTPVDVAFEFTTGPAAERHVETLLAHGVPTVCGTTGWDAAPMRALAAARGVPLLVEPNFALGVAVLRRLVALAAGRLLALPEWDAAVVERHHRAKRDRPSGTALALAALAAEVSGRAVPSAALRLGGEPGTHEVLFDGPDECLELTHRARSRRLFAAGAVAAAGWLLVRRPRGAVRLDELFDEVMEARSSTPEHGSPPTATTQARNPPR